MFVNLKPVEIWGWEWQWSGFRDITNSTSKTILNLLHPVNLNVWKVVAVRIIVPVPVVKFRMNNGGGNGTGCFETEIWTNFMNTIYWITYRMSPLWGLESVRPIKT